MMIRLLKRACVLVIVALLAVQVLVPPRPVRAASIPVTTPLDQFGEDTGHCSLREAIYSANTDTSFGGCAKGSGADVIILGTDEYYLTLNNTHPNPEYGKGDLDIYTTMTIVGTSARQTNVMGVSSNDRIFHIYKSGTLAAPTVTFKNFKISGGVTNSTNGGGGILLQHGSLIMSWVELLSNSAPIGGGVAVLPGTTLRATSMVFRSNQATTNTGAGGGIYNGGTMILENSLLVGNSAPGSGGGIDNRPFSATNYGLVQNTTIANNTSATSGAGISASGPGKLMLYSSTVAHNTGHGLLVNNGAIVIMRQTILSNNSVAPNCQKVKGLTGATLTSQGYNLIKDDPGSDPDQCAFTPDPAAQYPVLDLEGASFDPMLSTNLAPPLSSSPFMQWFNFTSVDSNPAIDTVDPAFPYCPDRDQTYHIRPANSYCDIGAIEYGADTGLLKTYLTFLKR